MYKTTPTLSETTINRLRDYCNENGIPFPDMDSWAIKNRFGKITKRFKKAIHQLHGYRVTKEQSNEIGQIINAATAPISMMYEIDSDMRLLEGEFGDGGSCFYEGNKHHWEMMQDHSGFHVVKIYDADGEPYGRAWLYNLNSGQGELREFLVFNIYSHGHLNLQLLGDMLHEQFGTYCLVTFESNLYVNNDRAIAFGGKIDPTITRQFDIGKICDCCERSVSEADVMHHNDICYCEDCFFELYVKCEWCQYYELADDSTYVDNHGFFCEYCYDHNFVECDHCDEPVHEDDAIEATLHDNTAVTLCEYCHNDLYECDSCGTTFEFYASMPDDDICPACNEL